MIIFEQVSKIYHPNTSALKDINLKIESGEFVSIVGPSGAGKTTLVKLLVAEEKVSAGNIIISDWDITRIKKSEIPFLRRQIGVVYQDFKLLKRRTVFENVAFALEVCGASPMRIEKIVPNVIKTVGLEGKEFRYPSNLSGGEQQRVAIARALVHAPKILVADEATGNLDPTNSKEIIELLLNINRIGITVIFVSHNQQLVNLIKKRVVVLNQCGIVSDEQVGRYINIIN